MKNSVRCQTYLLLINEPCDIHSRKGPIFGATRPTKLADVIALVVQVKRRACAVNRCKSLGSNKPRLD